MNVVWYGLICVLVCIPGVSANAWAKDKKAPLKHSTSFKSPRDLTAASTNSNIKLKNERTSSKLVYGLYIRQLSQVAAGQSCSGASVIYPNSGVGAAANTSVGAIAMSVRVGAKREADIGANFLYSMIYNTGLYINTVYPSTPPGCALPGCTWGSDTTIYNWCIQIGVLAPVSIASGYTTSNIVPVALLASTSDYDYNLVTTYENIGPISCDDQSLTCSVASPQTQSF